MLWQLLSAELSPYPGRLSLAARMTIACTLTMAIVMVFRIPSAALGAYLTLLVPRDNLRSMWRAVVATAVTSLAGTAVLLFAATLFAASPLLHFCWAVATLFGVFYLMSAMTVSVAPVALGLLAVNAISIWDTALPASARVTVTLYMEAAILIGCAVVTVVEIAFAQTHAPEMVFAGISERLRLTRQLLETYIAEKEPSHALLHQLRRYERRGIGRLHEVLQRSAPNEPARDQLGAILSLSAELIEVATNLAVRPQTPSPSDHIRMAALAAVLAQIERHFRNQELPDRVELPDTFAVSPTMPTLSELERTVDLIADAFSEEPAPPHLPRPAAWNASWLAPDAATSGRHMRTAIRGGLSALVCYLAYLSVGWKGLNASVVTCLLTALTSVGLSRQKQILRLLGIFAGGIFLGIGSQIFIFPHLDSLPEFALAFAAAIFACSWISASGPRLAYGGLQMALAYTLITLSAFGVNTSLVPARDVLFGILLGLAAMWLIYDNLWSVSSAKALRMLFANNLNRIANLHAELTPKDLARERLAIARNFEDLQSYADSVLFEPGIRHTPDAAIVDRIQHWQPELRALSLTQFGLLRHIAETGRQSPLSAASAAEVAQTLHTLAAGFHHQQPAPPNAARLDELLQELEQPTAALDGMELRLTHSLVVLAKDLAAMPDA